MRQGPLQNVRIIDLTKVWAGPLAARILADLGAEVIKVEYRNDRGPAAPRHGASSGAASIDQPYNRQSSFNKLNRNKKGLALDLTTSEGRAIFKRLAAVSDIVIDNFSARVMKNFGLDYPELSKVNPSIIVLSMPGFGMRGPYKDYVVYGPNLEPVTGLNAITGYSDDEVRSTSKAVPDAMAATHGAMAAVTALWRRLETGTGCMIDFSQHEVAVGFLGEYVLGYQLDGQAPHRLGNRHSSYAPQNCYRCAGEDNWVFVSVRDDEEFGRLCQVIGRPELAADQRFSDQESRWRNQALLDQEIQAWTSARDKQEVMLAFQAVGVPTGAVLRNSEMLADPHLAERGYFVRTDHAVVGRIPYPGLPIRMANQNIDDWAPAPLLGEHNQEILEELLGFPNHDIEEFWRSGIVANTPSD